MCTSHSCAKLVQLTSEWRYAQFIDR